MESCEIGDHGPSAEVSNEAVTCNGSCRRKFPACFVSSSGLILTSGDGSEDRFWFCYRCRKNLCPMTRKRSGSSGLERIRKVVKMDLPNLPPEIWIEIFMELLRSELLQVRLVCRHWRDIVDGTFSLRSKLILKFEGCAIVGCNYNTQCLYPASKVSFYKNLIIEVGSWWPAIGQNLVDITISTCEIALLNLLEMFKHAPNLKSLETYELFLTGDLSVVADFRLEKVEQLSIDGVFATELTKALRDMCCNVRCLRITWNNNDYPLSPSEMAGFVGGLRNTLTELHINASEDILIELAKLKPFNLKKLTLAGDSIENYKLVMGFCQMHSSLEYIDIHQVIEFGQTSARERNEMVQRLSELQFLSIYVSENTEEDLIFLSHFVKLQNLTLHCCHRRFRFISSDSVQLSQLRVLHLECFDFTETNFRQCFIKIPNLYKLTIVESIFNCWTDFLMALLQLKLLQNLILHSIRWIRSYGSRRCLFDCTDSHNSLSIDFRKIPHETLDMALGLCPNLWKLHSNVPNTVNYEVLRAVCRQIYDQEFDSALRAMHNVMS